MTVAEFPDWSASEGSGARWQLRDGEPEMMAPPSERHGSIQAELARLIGNALLERGSACRAVTEPGVVPRLRTERNMLAADIGVTCDAPSGTHALPNPVVLIEIPSPSNHDETRANIGAFASIPSVVEMVVLRSWEISAEVLRRQADGAWPEKPVLLGPDDELRLDSIGFRAALRAAYRTAGLT